MLAINEHTWSDRIYPSDERFAQAKEILEEFGEDTDRYPKDFGSRLDKEYMVFDLDAPLVGIKSYTWEPPEGKVKEEAGRPTTERTYEIDYIQLCDHWRELLDNS